MNRNFYYSSHAPYYIFALDYIQQSAGIRALHYLCHALNESGLEAYVICKVTSPNLRTPLLDDATIRRHQMTGRKPIVVYPEIVPGDPFAMDGVVVRWLLNRPGHIGGDATFHKDELIFAYNPSYLPAGMQGRILHIPTCDLAIFNNDNNADDERRELTSFYAHKYLAKGGTLTGHVENAVSLCKDQTLSHAEIAGILRRTRVLYVYEPTALITEALLCGCPVAIIETDYWRENQPGFVCPTEDGVTMDDSPAAISRARENVRNYRTKYEDFFLREAWIQLDRFVNFTQRTAKTRITS